MTMQSKGWLLLPRRRGLAASNLHEELDQRRDRNNDGRPKSDFNLKIYGTGSLTLRFSGQPPNYVDLRTMERISSKNKTGYPAVICIAFGYLVQGSPSHS